MRMLGVQNNKGEHLLHAALQLIFWSFQRTFSPDTEGYTNGKCEALAYHVSCKVNCTGPNLQMRKLRHREEKSTR